MPIYESPDGEYILECFLNIYAVNDAIDILSNYSYTHMSCSLIKILN